MKSEEYYIKEALKEAKKAYLKNEIPVGAVIVLDGKIISKAHNKRDETNIVTEHAEIIAIRKANKKLKNWRLNECIMYCTLEPCNMCKEVIKNSKIKKVIYSASAEKTQVKLKNVEYKQIVEKKLVDESSKLIKDAFKKIREKTITSE